VSSLAPALEAFFTQRLLRQLQASPHTVAAYRDTFRLLLVFAQHRTGKAPCQLELADVDAELIGAFLEHLETDRHNTARTRNARLGAIRSFFRFVALREPAHAGHIQRVLAIPPKRHEQAVVTYLTADEIDVLVASPDRQSWIGRRDHALLVLAVQTGLRVSELTCLCRSDVVLGAGAHVRCHGKGRKQRCTPLGRHTVAILTAWMNEQPDRPSDSLFPTRQGRPLSTDAVEDLVDKYAGIAKARCLSLRGKNVTPHTLRHTSAMALLRSRVDVATIALWLGHERVQTTSIYIHGDLTIKEQALARLAPPNTKPGRYRPPDPLLAFLESL
jgi:site-specific recombinase XerD